MSTSAQVPGDLSSPGTDPTQALLDLHKSAQLAKNYKLVRELVSQMSGADLLRAGRILTRLDAQKVLEKQPDIPVVTVAITGHGTVSTLIPALTAELARHGLLLKACVADFGNYVPDLLNATSILYAPENNLVLCLLDATTVFDKIPVPWRVADAQRALNDHVELLEHLVDRFEANSKATLVLNTMPLPRRFTAQLIDYKSRNLLGALWHEANARLLKLAASRSGVVVIDLGALITEGVALSDMRMSAYAKAHLSEGILALYARDIGHLARHVFGRSKKCLVVDLDGTLWGGMLGDDGPDGIEVSEGLRGETFQAFQRVIKQLGSQGVLLAAVSKNNQETVLQVLRDHPGMALREDDFVRVTANWEPKPANIAEIARVLNIGVDSFVFADDSAYECGFVRRELPDVAVVQLDAEPAMHTAKVLSDGWFDVKELTEEDTVRVTQYREEGARANFLEQFSSVDDYLRELDITVRFGPPEDREITRVSQLTLRTNQFNLTSRRLQVTEVRQLASDSLAVLAIRSSDRFGDNGFVGAVFTHRDKDSLHIDNFMLSCRVFSRGIERVCLLSLLRRASAEGARKVYAEFLPTAKNAIVRDFYPRHGFSVLEESDTKTTFFHDLKYITAPPQHIRLIEDFRDP